MLVASEIQHLSIPRRFIAYAHAYRDAAELANNQLVGAPDRQVWANAAVVLMLTAHATELFLKGMILSRSSDADIDHHRINDLVQEYERLFTEEGMSWCAPMQTRYVGFAADEIVALRKQTPVPSILYRYPTDKGGTEWRGVYGFEPISFAQLLHGLKQDFRRIETAA